MHRPSAQPAHVGKHFAPYRLAGPPVPGFLWANNFLSPAIIINGSDSGVWGDTVVDGVVVFASGRPFVRRVFPGLRCRRSLQTMTRKRATAKGPKNDFSGGLWKFREDSASV